MQYICDLLATGCDLNDSRATFVNPFVMNFPCHKLVVIRMIPDACWGFVPLRRLDAMDAPPFRSDPVRNMSCSNSFGQLVNNFLSNCNINALNCTKTRMQPWKAIRISCYKICSFRTPTAPCTFSAGPGVEFVGSCEYLKMHGHGIKSTSDGYVFVQNCTCRNQHSCRRFDFHPGGSVRWILGPCRSASCVTASGFVWKWTKTCLIPLDNHHFSGKLQQIQCLALLRGLNSWHFHSQRTQGLWWRIA